MATRASMDRSAGQTLPAAVLDSIVTGVISTETATPTVLVGEGSHWVRTDLDLIMLRNGTGNDESCGGYGPWQTYTPTVHNGAGVSVGGFSTSGRYRFVAARTIQVSVALTATAASAPTGLQFALPYAMANSNDVFGFRGAILDSGTGYYMAHGSIPSSVSLVAVACVTASAAYASLSGIDSATPMTWAVNDAVLMSGIYESVLA